MNLARKIHRQQQRKLPKPLRYAKLKEPHVVPEPSETEAMAQQVCKMVADKPPDKQYVVVRLQNRKAAEQLDPHLSEEIKQQVRYWWPGCEEEVRREREAVADIPRHTERNLKSPVKEYHV